MVITPCIKQCRVENGECASCGRSLQQIKEWRDMSNEDRLEIMNKLKTRNNTHSCPSCSDKTYCAMLDGKSGSACWCMGETIPIKNTLTATDGDLCLCKKCLQNA